MDQEIQGQVVDVSELRAAETKVQIAEVRARLVGRIRAAALLVDAGDHTQEALRELGDEFFWDCYRYGGAYLSAYLDRSKPTPEPEGWWDAYMEKRKADRDVRHRFAIEEAAASAAAAFIILDNVKGSDSGGLDMADTSVYEGTLPRILKDVDNAVNRLLIELGRVLNQNEDATFARVGEWKREDDD